MTTEPTEPTEPTYVEVLATCHTDECGNAGIPIALLTVEGGAVFCGVCGQPITDILPVNEPQAP